jgi:hypothetical protein
MCSWDHPIPALGEAVFIIQQPEVLKKTGLEIACRRAQATRIDKPLVTATNIIPVPENDLP